MTFLVYFGLFAFLLRFILGVGGWPFLRKLAYEVHCDLTACFQS